MFARSHTRWALIVTVGFIIIVASLASPALARPPEEGILTAQNCLIVKVDLADPVPVDGLVTYRIDAGLRISAGGLPPEQPWLHARWSVDDILPAGMQYVSSSPEGIYDAGQQHVRWELGGLLPGATRTMLITLRPDPSVILTTTEVTNRAQFWVWEVVPPTATSTPTPTPTPQQQCQGCAESIPNVFSETAMTRRLVNETAETTTIIVPEREPPTSVTYSRILQQGKDSYVGNEDTYIDSNYPMRNYAHTPWMYLKTVDSTSILSRFDLTGLPAGADITKARLRFYVGATAPINAPISLQLYGSLRTWDEAGATWMQAQTDMAWASPGANGAGDRASLPDAAVDCYAPPLSSTRIVEFDVTALAQEWLASPSSNDGVVVKPAICRGTALYYIYSADSRVRERRPELYLEYIAPPAP